MTPTDCLRNLVRRGEQVPEAVEHANDNWRAKPEWMSPAELMQIIRRERASMRRELIADFSLRACPKHRHFRESLDGLEAFTRWRYFREA